MLTPEIIRQIKTEVNNRTVHPTPPNSLPMAMPRETAVSIAHNVFLLLDGWVWTCVVAADEAARLLRSATR
ncbi:unnamed protein product [Urochloa decumbens]|uniref:Uncharacterized protein n=2 Tax=Urochloa decumbens TaxID=240449 RepID=A0ABC8VKE8_9POAL